jgi:hypothetical protein
MIEDLDIEDGDEEGDRLYLEGVASLMEEWESEADEVAYGALGQEPDINA